MIGLDRLDAKRLPVDLPLYTRNIDDLRRLDHLLTIVAV
ncbi:MAG: type II toxin-antitoxin system VapC family toxin [Mycobacterium sp.]|nr:MAG: type II toxin-antitoxin system VapC family toxin [Mycobacterium sp.]